MFKQKNGLQKAGVIVMILGVVGFLVSNQFALYPGVQFKGYLVATVFVLGGLLIKIQGDNQEKSKKGFDNE
jgi:hypothetical protein